MMNPGPVEEAGQFSRAIVDALRSQPVMLAVLVFNLAFMGVLTYTAHDNNERWERLVSVLISCSMEKGK